MKHALIGALVAVIATLVTVELAEDGDDSVDIDALAAAVASREPFAGRSAPLVLSYTEELGEDAWVNGARGAGVDHKPLAATENSICFLTRVEIKGGQGPADSNACAITVDDFTGFWEVTASVEEGGQSEVRCNARCLVWERGDDNDDAQ